MAIKAFKPTSPGQRIQTVFTFDEITTDRPYKPLTEGKKRINGRNNRGWMTISSERRRP